jgi:hypothetical protein
LPERETIVFGTYSSTVRADVQEAIIDFNNRSQKYRIEVKDYDNGEGYEAGICS